MRIGYWYVLVDDGIPPAQLGRELEERGVEGLFLGEHTNLPVASAKPGDEQDRIHPRIADPLTTLAVIAGATERLTLGTAVLLAAQHEPIATAKAVATLDAFSGGRVVLGVGPGWHAGELASHGVDPKKKVAVLREHMLAMREIWTKDEAEFHGEHVDFAPLYSWPKPVGGPTVLAGGGLDPAWRKITQYADGWLPIYPGDTEPLAADIAEMRRRAAELGRELPVTVMNAPADVAALAVLAEAGVDRVLLELPRAGRDATVRTLDGHADLLARTW
ncbi:MAG: TIGR03619 family F420-dependent LLM class oxidoreductase [Actinophytocola sp.]|uniref:TIGR03619 family F420-dependent LLM class oxidoreductase n=1 Tax=Actinophytocola sp. TaxID=1872138 RepID=UPI00132A7CCA|nr:TIGR03619 family F420-dependent LLM class oxidoreductase [Actinophytocola sp.]MPZ82266.1 TIGR03619 family F420-dependent LLM class oxidoreductase [Actinophytocola sp.]